MGIVSDYLLGKKELTFSEALGAIFVVVGFVFVNCEDNSFAKNKNKNEELEDMKDRSGELASPSLDSRHN